MHNTLAQLTEKFSLSIFDHSDMTEYAERALNNTTKWHLRECLLKALFVLWFVVLMSIYRIAELGAGDYLVRLTKQVSIPQKRGTRQHARRTINFNPEEECYTHQHNKLQHSIVMRIENFSINKPESYISSEYQIYNAAITYAPGYKLPNEC